MSGHEDLMVDTTPKPRVGVIGTGAMGSRFARRLARAGFEVHAHNRTRAKADALADAGVVVEDTPRALAEATDVILCMLWDSEALREMADGPDGFVAGLTSRHVVADASTVEPEVSAGAAQDVASAGAVMVDTPVSGSLDAAENGTVVVMVGGPAAGLERARPVLEEIGRLVLHVSEVNGSGLVLKLAINLQVAIQEVAWGEGLALAELFGITRAEATDVMLQSVIASPMLKYRVPFVADPPDEIWASASQLWKDVGYAVARSGGRAVAGQHALDLLDTVRANGRGDLEAVELILAAAGDDAQIGAGR
jgi:3-hydroxyisobutyrate dehydrogenase-like beta-hydroxyacid dehydrogenase